MPSGASAKPTGASAKSAFCSPSGPRRSSGRLSVPISPCRRFCRATVGDLRWARPSQCRHAIDVGGSMPREATRCRQSGRRTQAAGRVDDDGAGEMGHGLGGIAGPAVTHARDIASSEVERGAGGGNLRRWPTQPIGSGMNGKSVTRNCFAPAVPVSLMAASLWPSRARTHPEPSRARLKPR
jgi:hypothetical protein